MLVDRAAGGGDRQRVRARRASPPARGPPAALSGVASGGVAPRYPFALLLLPDRRACLDLVDDLPGAGERRVAVRRGDGDRDRWLRQRHACRCGARPPRRRARDARSRGATISAISRCAISTYASYSSSATSRVTPRKVAIAPGARVPYALEQVVEHQRLDRSRGRAARRPSRRRPAGSAPPRHPAASTASDSAYSWLTAITTGTPSISPPSWRERVAHAGPLGQLDRDLVGAGALAQRGEQAHANLHDRKASSLPALCWRRVKGRRQRPHLWLMLPPSSGKGAFVMLSLKSWFAVPVVLAVRRRDRGVR